VTLKANSKSLPKAKSSTNWLKSFLSNVNTLVDNTSPLDVHMLLKELISIANETIPSDPSKAKSSTNWYKLFLPNVNALSMKMMLKRLISIANETDIDPSKRKSDADWLKSFLSNVNALTDVKMTLKTLLSIANETIPRDPSKARHERTSILHTNALGMKLMLQMLISVANETVPSDSLEKTWRHPKWLESFKKQQGFLG